MRVIGLTGGIGAGKSEAARVLAGLGAAVIDADAEGHRAYSKGTIGWRRIVEIFSADLLDDEGEVDRKRLGSLVFASPQALAWLNAAIHPLIRERIIEAIAELRGAGWEAAVVDAALLHQAGWDDLTDETWAVFAPAADVAERLKLRGLSAEEIRRRLEAQEPTEHLLARADALIDNSGAPEDLEGRVRELWEERILAKGSAIHGRAD